MTVDVTKWIDPRNWLWWALGMATVVAGLWFGVVRPYNNYVSAKAVDKALNAERAVSVPLIEGLHSKVANMEAASKAEALRQRAVINLKTKEYQNAIAQNKLFKEELDSQRSSDADFERLLNTINDHDRAAGTGISDRFERLKTAHEQCERDLRYSAETSAGTLERLGAAIAAIDALKLK